MFGLSPGSCLDRGIILWEKSLKDGDLDILLFKDNNSWVRYNHRITLGVVDSV